MFFPHNSAMNNNTNTSKNSSTPAARGIVLYARLSVESTDGSNDSLERQISLGKKYAAFADLNILGIFSEVASGKNAKKREEFSKAVKLAKKEKAVLWVYSLSRFSRNVADTVTIADGLEKAGATLYSHNEKLDCTSSQGRFVLTMLSACATLEREEIVARTKFALGEKRKANRVISTFTPYGYKKSGKNLIEIPRQQKIISKMAHMREEGFSFAAIAQEINRSGEKSATGKNFNPSTIQKILVRREKLLAPALA